MASNLWVESYLELLMCNEALPTLGSAGAVVASPSSSTGRATPDRELGSSVGRAAADLELSPEQESARSNFFVQRILESISEEDVALSWARAVAGGQGASRLRNTLWRVWHLMRKRSQVSREEENEAETESEFESLAGDEDEQSSSPRAGREPSPSSPRSSSSSPSRADLLLSPPGRLPALLESELDDSQKDSVYLVLISLHGLVRGTEMELGRDSDTGGQVRYVVELARALAQHPRIHRCDLFTRLITDASVDASYGVVEERLTEEQEGDAGAFIVRLRAGKPDVYLHKELLWPHLREFADRAIERIDGQLRSLEASHGRQFRLLCIHGHYADAAELSSLIGATLSGRVVVTGHSLGRNKLASILASGKMTRAEVEATYRIGRRIEAEERALDSADCVIVSTETEIRDQWGVYAGYDPVLEASLARTRRFSGRAVPSFVVIPPGLDFSTVTPLDPDAPLPVGDDEPPLWRDVNRFLAHPAKPVILVIARPDSKKNIPQLVRAYAEMPLLRDLANLVLFLGCRDGINDMPANARAVLAEVIALTDEFDLWGSIAFPKKHLQSQKSDIFNFCAARRGVFANIALNEPFGLVFIEAAAHGVPTVGTKYGGPVEIANVLSNGLLVEPTSRDAISRALVDLLTDRQLYMRCRRNGLERIHLYSWASHVKRFLGVHDALDRTSREVSAVRPAIPPPSTTPPHLVCVLLDSRDMDQSAQLVKSALGVVGAASIIVSSTACQADTAAALQSAGVDVSSLRALIVDCGASIVERGSSTTAQEWLDCISFRFLRGVAARAVLEASLGTLVLEPAVGGSLILRFSLKGGLSIPALHILMRRVRRRGIRLTLHYSAGAAELRALPLRASRALAMRWLARRWGIPFERVVVLASATIEPDGDRADALSGLVHPLLVGGEAPPIRPVTEMVSNPSDAAAVVAAHVERCTWVKSLEELGPALKVAVA